MNPLIAAAQGDLTIFGKDPFWLVLIKAVVLFLALVLLTLFTTWFERRGVGLTVSGRQGCSSPSPTESSWHSSRGSPL